MNLLKLQVISYTEDLWIKDESSSWVSDTRPRISLVTVTVLACGCTALCAHTTSSCRHRFVHQLPDPTKAVLDFLKRWTHEVP